MFQLPAQTECGFDALLNPTPACTSLQIQKEEVEHLIITYLK